MLDNLKKYDIVLASGSPRRRELLEGLGLSFRVEVIKGIKECYPPTLPVDEVPEYLSRLKSHAYNVTGNELLITADTVVVLGGELIGKPHSEQEAREMLHKLSGNTHTVVTGVTIRSVASRRWNLPCSPTRKLITMSTVTSLSTRLAAMAYRTG